MTQHCDDDFRTIDLILNSDCASRGVDAFCLAWIKYERQLRKLTAYLLFQASALSNAQAKEVRASFLANTGMSHTSTRGAIWRLTGESAKSLIGVRYANLNNSIEKSYRAREKIFHGKQTGNTLSRAELLSMVKDISDWCKLLSDAANDAFGYDGFAGKTSLFKGNRPELVAKVDHRLKNDWKAFVASL